MLNIFEDLMQAILFDLYEDFESLDRKTKSAFLKLIKYLGEFVTKDDF